MPFSHHSHSGEFCDHAKDTLESCILQAISKKLRIFALTEHMPRYDVRDLYPEEVELGLTPVSITSRFADYHRAALALRDKYKEDITILIGFEVDFIRPSMEAEIQDVRNTYDFDLFVGSVHHVEEIPIDYSKEMYLKAIATVEALDAGTESELIYNNGKHIQRFPDIEVTGSKGEERLFEAYFDTQYAMLRTLNPPIIGHFDLIRLKSDDYKVDFRNFKHVWEKIVRNVKYISKYGGMVEINSAALRKGWEHPYPGPDILQLMKDEGVRFVLSDDSHGTAQVAFGYEKCLDYLEQQGVEEVWYYEWSGFDRDVQTGILMTEDRYLPRVTDVQQQRVKVKDLRGIVPE